MPAKPLKLVKRIEAPKTPSHLSIDSTSSRGLCLAAGQRRAAGHRPGHAGRALEGPTGKMPADLYLTPDDRLLLVGLTGDRFVEAYDVSVPPAEAGQAHCHRQRRARLPLDGRRAPPVRQQPRGQHHQPDRPPDAGVVAELPGPGGPDCMDLLADRRTLLVSSRWARKLSVHRHPSRKVVQQIDVGRSPHGVWTLDHAPRQLSAVAGPAAAWLPLAVAAAPACDKPVYLTFDTGHMGVAPLVAEVLAAPQVKATFFLANERTLDGGSSLDDALGAVVAARAAEGHAFGSHTWDHDVWLADVPAAARAADHGAAGRASRACWTPPPTAPNWNARRAASRP
jgi:hypothetical protein